MTAWLRGCRDQPKGGRRKVTRDREVPRLRDLIAEDSDSTVIALCRAHEKIIKNELCVISAWRRLIDRRFSFREKAGEKHGTFHLRTSDWRSVINAAQRASVDAKRRRLFGPFGYNVGAHLSKRRNDAIHGAPSE